MKINEISTKKSLQLAFVNKNKVFSIAHTKGKMDIIRGTGWLWELEYHKRNKIQ